MKTIYHLFLGLFLITIVISCSNKAAEELAKEDTLYKEIMAVHDEVMPRMSEIESSKRQLLDYKKDWPKGTDSIFLMKMPQFLDGLNEASDEMMDWMHNFKTKESWSDTGTYLQYLTKERVSIKWVKITMRNSIDEAKYMLRLISGEEKFEGK